jgi:hypothetical protein
MTPSEKAIKINQQHELVTAKIQFVYSKIEEKRKTATPEEHKELDALVARLESFTYEDPFTAKVPAEKIIFL